VFARTDVAIVTTTLLLIRHAQPEGHQQGYPLRLSGWHDVPLSAAGRVEAALLAQRLEDEDLGGPIYASPLSRAMETATAIAAVTGQIIARVAQLKEIHCGEIEGRLVEHVRRAYPAQWAANLRQDDADFRWPGGESYREFHTRCLAGIARIAASHHGRRIAVVTHTGVVSQLIGHIRGVSPAQWDCFRPGTASITALEWRDESSVVLTFNDQEHLRSHAVHAVTRREHPP